MTADCSIYIIGFLAILIFLYWMKRNGDRELAAMHRWCNMGDVFHELRDDPFMTTAKWRDLLPLFEEADHAFARTHPHLKKSTRYADLVRQEINGSPYEEIGSP